MIKSFILCLALLLWATVLLVGCSYESLQKSSADSQITSQSAHTIDAYAAGTLASSDNLAEMAAAAAKTRLAAHVHHLAAKLRSGDISRNRAVAARAKADALRQKLKQAELAGNVTDVTRVAVQIDQFIQDTTQ